MLLLYINPNTNQRKNHTQKKKHIIPSLQLRLGISQLQHRINLGRQPHVPLNLDLPRHKRFLGFNFPTRQLQKVFIGNQDGHIGFTGWCTRPDGSGPVFEVNVPSLFLAIFGGDFECKDGFDLSNEWCW